MLFDLFFILFVDSHSSAVSIDDGREWGKERKRNRQIVDFFFADSVDDRMCRCLFVYSFSFSSFFFSPHIVEGTKYNIFSLHIKLVINKISIFISERNSIYIFIHIYHFFHFLFSFNSEYLAVVYPQTITPIHNCLVSCL